jgi:hypothetical protein
MPTDLTPLERAIDYTARRGWRVIPIPFRSKNPGFEGWQRLFLDVDDLPRYFSDQPKNIGFLCGEPSGNVVDVDVDCPEAVLGLREQRLLRPQNPPAFSVGRRSRGEQQERNDHRGPSQSDHRFSPP